MRKNILIVIAAFVGVGVFSYFFVFNSFGHSFRGISGWGPVLRPVFSVVLLVAGAFMILLGILLKLRRVQPGRYWGNSARSSLTQGTGFVLWGLQYFIVGDGSDRTLETVGMGLWFVGMILEFRDRPPSESRVRKLDL